MIETQVINGSYGYVHQEGTWLSNVTNFQANVQINKEEILMAGTRWVGHKTMSLVGTGTMSGFKINSDLAKKIAQIADDKKKAFVTELIGKLDDPDNPDGKTRVRIKNVQFDTIPLLNYEVGQTVKEELPFTFRGLEYLD